MPLFEVPYSYIVPTSTVVTAATKPVRVPSFQFSGGINYMKNVPALDGSLGGSVSYRHNSSYFVAIANTAMVPREDYVDAAVRYAADQNKWEMSFEVSNLTKQKTVTANFLALFPGDPRRFTLRFKTKM